VHDKRLFTALAAATGAAGNSTSLVGTAEQVVDSLLDYINIGVTTILIRGYDPLPDAEAYGEVIRLTREAVASHGRQSGRSEQLVVQAITD
jgi:alkanesulfonate monooxygenase